MSSNQRPTKVRVFSSQSSAPDQRRRRTDVPLAAEAAPEVETTAQPMPIAEAKTGGGRMVWLVILFLIGCALGGAALSLLGLGMS